MCLARNVCQHVHKIRILSGVLFHVKNVQNKTNIKMEFVNIIIGTVSCSKKTILNLSKSVKTLR